MVSIFEENDAGFEHIITAKGKDFYESHTDSYRQKVSGISDYDDCQAALEGWLKFFRTDHYRLTKTQSIRSKQNSANIWAQQFVDSPTIIDMLAGQDHSVDSVGFLGFWRNREHSILIVEQGDQYMGVVVDDSLPWKKGQIVFKTHKISKSGNTFQSSFRPIPVNRFELLGNNILTINQSTYIRDNPHTLIKDHDYQYYNLKNSSETFAERVDDSTMYLRIPSFSFNKRAIDSVLSVFDSAICSTPNLIIDLRDCQGGQDNNFAKLLPYISSGPIRTVTAEVLSTPLNNMVWNEIINNPELSDSEKETYSAIKTKLDDNIGKFVNIFGVDVVKSQPQKMYNYPKNVGIIIHENNFSTTEQFILAAKQSKKVKFFGRKTGGALDVSNMVESTLSTGDFTFEYCISRSLRIPAMSVDDMGIHPDFYLDKTIGDNHWIDFVGATLNSWL